MNFEFAVVGSPGTVSRLNFETLIFNEGDPRATTTAGKVEYPGNNE